MSQDKDGTIVEFGQEVERSLSAGERAWRVVACIIFIIALVALIVKVALKLCIDQKVIIIKPKSEASQISSMPVTTKAGQASLVDDPPSTMAPTSETANGADRIQLSVAIPVDVSVLLAIGKSPVESGASPLQAPATTTDPGVPIVVTTGDPKSGSPPISAEESSTSTKVTREAAQKSLEKGIDISPETISQLTSLLDDIKKRRSTAQLNFIKSGTEFSVFSIVGEHNLVFKMHNTGDPKKIEERFRRTVVGQQVIMEHNLDLLHIPPTTIVRIGKSEEYSLLVERRIHFQPDRYKQEELYYRNVSSFKPTAIQQTQFVYYTEDDDVRFANYAIVDLYGNDFIPRHRMDGTHCVPFDLEYANDSGVASPEKQLGGFLGDYYSKPSDRPKHHGSCGLIGMMFSEELIDSVFDEGVRLGLSLDPETRKAVKNKRMAEIEAYKRQRKLIDDKPITGGDLKAKFISDRDINALGLTLDLKGVSDKVIEFINTIYKKKVQSNNQTLSFDDPYMPHLCYAQERSMRSCYLTLSVDLRESDVTSILDALVRKELIASYENLNGVMEIKF